MQFVGRHHEVFGHFDGRLLPGTAGRVRHFADGQPHRIAGTEKRFSENTKMKKRIHLALDNHQITSKVNNYVNTSHSFHRNYTTNFPEYSWYKCRNFLENTWEMKYDTVLRIYFTFFVL